MDHEIETAAVKTESTADRTSTLFLCFSGVEDGAVCGELWSFYEEAPRPFRGLDHLLFAMEDALDAAGQRSVWCQRRDIRPLQGRRAPAPEPCYTAGELMEKRGSLSTAAVRVHFRRNASFQGELRLYDPARTVCFRSALELIHLLWSELGGT